MAKKNIMDKVQDLLMDKKFDCAICLARTNDEHIIRSMRGNGDDIIESAVKPLALAMGI